MAFALVLILGLMLTLVVTAEALAAPTRVENTDSHITYFGGWTLSQLPTGAHSGGSYSYSSSTNAYATVAFMGTSLDWIAARSSGRRFRHRFRRPWHSRHRRIYYAASPEYQAKVWGTGTLPDGFHTVKILRVTGTINVDAFDITGAIVAYSQARAGR